MDIKLFFNNQQSIKPYDIAESFRKQNFYIATSKLKKLLEIWILLPDIYFHRKIVRHWQMSYSLFYWHYLTHRTIVIMFYRRIL